MAEVFVGPISGGRTVSGILPKVVFRRPRSAEISERCFIVWAISSFLGPFRAWHGMANGRVLPPVSSPNGGAITRNLKKRQRTSTVGEKGTAGYKFVRRLVE